MKKHIRVRRADGRFMQVSPGASEALKVKANDNISNVTLANVVRWHLSEHIVEAALRDIVKEVKYAEKFFGGIKRNEPPKFFPASD